MIGRWTRYVTSEQQQHEASEVKQGHRRGDLVNNLIAFVFGAKNELREARSLVVQRVRTFEQDFAIKPRHLKAKAHFAHSLHNVHTHIHTHTTMSVRISYLIAVQATQLIAIKTKASDN